MKTLDHVNIDYEISLYLTFNNVDGHIECNLINFNTIEKKY